MGYRRVGGVRRSHDSDRGRWTPGHHHSSPPSPFPISDPGFLKRGPVCRTLNAWSGVFGASLIAFFAFTGFEGLANIAEEVKSPGSTIPRAILITLVLTTLLYVLVVWVALNVIPLDELGTDAGLRSLACSSG